MICLTLRVKTVLKAMPSRKRKEFCNLPIETKPEFVTELKEIANSEECLPCVKWLHEFLHSTDAIHQASLVKQIRQSFQKMQSSCQDQVLLCCRVLSDVYLGLDLKNILKRTVASALQGSPEALHAAVTQFLQEALLSRLQDVAEDTDEEKFRHVVDSVIACFDNFPLGEKCVAACVMNVLQFSSHVLILLTEQLRKECSPLEATHYCQNLQALVRSLVLTLQKCSGSMETLLISPSSRDFMLEVLAHILRNILACLNDDGILLDCRMHCGMAVPLLLKLILGADYFTAILQVAYPKQQVETKEGNGKEGGGGDDEAEGEGNGAPRAPVTLNIQQQLEGLPADLAFTLSLLGALPTASQLCLTCGLLCTVSPAELGKEEPPETKSSPLVTTLLPELMRISNSGNSTITINCCKGLLLWTQRVRDVLETSSEITDLHQQFLEGCSPVNRQMMDFLWSHWEHFIDGVRHFARDIFNNVLTIHRLIEGKAIGKKTFVQELMRQLLTMPSHQRSKYYALCSLVDYVGAGEILQHQPTIAQDLLAAMEEKAIACHACELFEKLFVTHFAEMHDDLTRWQHTWVTPTLTALSQDSSAIELEHVLTQLLKRSPETLHYITSLLVDEDCPTSAVYVRAVLKAMKTARAIGLVKVQVPNSPPQSLWNNLLSYSLLQQALRHIKDEIRLDAFGLLCESHKSTEVISRLDLEFIGTFLSENMSNQSSAFRQQMLAYIKKLINRIRDGGQVLHRKLVALQRKEDEDDEIHSVQSILTYYQDFLNWLADLQFRNLHLGANFPRRGTALQILSLLHQQIGFQPIDNSHYFSLSHSLTYQNVQTLLECLRDTYEVNKNYAGTILHVIPAETLGFQDEHRLSAIFEAALALASSPHPSESVTAAHLLRLLSHYSMSLNVAVATKHFLEEQSRSQEASGRNTPVVEMDKENSSLQEYLMQNMRTNDKTLDILDTTYAIVDLLLFQLQTELECAKYSLLEAASSAPMYGLLFCIRMLLGDIDLNLAARYDQWRNLITSLLDICFLLSEVVSPVVNNSSPEGHLPMDSEPESLFQLHATLQKALGHNTPTEKLWKKRTTDGGDCDHYADGYSEDMAVKMRSVTAQMVLLCSWRTIKEVSLLLGDICQRAPLPCDDGSCHNLLLTRGQIITIGNYFTAQLSEMKHRGAFEQAYVGFCKMCSRLWRIQGELHLLPKQWLQELIQQLEESPSPKLCKTRRSAGIPFMVRALVSTEPGVTNYACFNDVMKRLLNFAMDQQYSDSDAQIHALNILRALYRDMHLGEGVMPFVADGMKAAISGFRGKIWAVRNSSTLLFSALMTRIFGVKRCKDEHARKNCMTGRVFFQRFPSLYQFLINELTSAAEICNTTETIFDADKTNLALQPSLYPILLLLSRLYPSALEGSDSNLKLSSFIPYVEACSSSAIIKTRSLAAQALIPLIPVNSYDITLHKFIMNIPEDTEKRIKQNHIHGILLQIQQLLSGLDMVPQEVFKNIADNFGKWMEGRLWIYSKSNLCLFTKTSFLNILDTALADNILNLETTLVSEVQRLLLEEIDGPGKEMHTPGYPLHRANAARFLLTLQVFTMNIAGTDASVYWSSSELSALGRTVSGGDIKGQTLAAHYDSTSCPNWSSSEESSPSKQDDDNTLNKFLTIICRLLCDEYYEVRMVVMQWMRELLQPIDNGQCLTEREETILRAPKSTRKLVNSRQGQFCAQQLLISKNVILALVAMAMNQEEHPECITELFHLLCLFPLAIQLPWPDPESPNKWLNSLEKLDIILQRGEAELRDDLRCSLLRFSGCLVTQVYLDLAEAPEDSDLQPKSILEEWSDAFLLCCSPEQSYATRKASADVLFNVANYLLIDPHHILGSGGCLMWSALVRLLLDDDPKIKQKAAEIVNIFDNFPPLPGLELNPCDVQPAIALDLVVGYFVEQYGERYQTECLTTLLDWCLREETTESFHPIDEEDRVFDKGEMNIYCEEVTLTNIVVKHLKRLLRHVFGGSRPNSQPNNPFAEQNLKKHPSDMVGFSTNESEDSCEVVDKPLPGSLTSDSLAVLSMPSTVKDAVMTNFTIPTYQVSSWLPAADNLEQADDFLLRDIVSMVTEELSILLSEIPPTTNKTPFVCRQFERQIMKSYRRVMVVTSLGKYDANQKESMLEIENTLMNKFGANLPHTDHLIFIMLTEIKKVTCVLSQDEN